MLRHIVIGVVVLAVLSTGVGYGAWGVPAVHPEEARLIEADKTARRSAVYEAYEAAMGNNPCAKLTDPSEKAACDTKRESYSIDERLVYLLVPQAIPDKDCALMARVLKDNGFKNDEAIYVNYQGRSNCDFSKYGLAHIGERDRYENWGVSASGKSFREEYGLSEATGVFGLRSLYVTRPIYSLFGTRMKIEYGRLSEGGSGSVCYYNRFMGEWRREGGCQMAWVS